MIDHVPSVSSLIDLLNKPALLYWANNLGLQGKKVFAERQNNMQEGTYNHLDIENYVKHGIFIEDIKKQENLNIFLEKVSIIDIEARFKNDEYKGRCDVIFTKDNLKYIGDFKRKYKKPYLEHYLQLIAYKQHFKADKICIIDTDVFTIYELKLDYENEIMAILRNLINIYNIKKQIEL